MKFFLTLVVCLFVAGVTMAQEPNPRLKNFRYGTGKAIWWETPRAVPQPRTQMSYYPPSIRYYSPMPYYHRHHPHCRCYNCFHRNQQMMMWQLQMNPNKFFFFQFRF